MGMFDSFANFGSSVFDFASAEYFRDKQSDELTSNRQFSGDQSRMQMEFQERMRKTQYQTAVEDLRAAGLNPALAYMHGGAGTPAGASGSAGGTTSAQAIAPSESRLKASLSSQSAAQVELLAAQERNVNADTAVKNATEAEIRARTPTHAVQIDKLRQEIEQSQEHVRLMIAQANQSTASAEHFRQQVTNLREAVPQIQASVRQLDSLTRLNDQQVRELASRIGRQEAETKEILQRVKQNLPELEAIVKHLEAQARQADMPRREQESNVHRGELSGWLAALWKVFNPLANLLGAAK